MSLFEIQQYQIAEEITNTKDHQTLYWSYVKDRDITLKISLQNNFTKPMLKFPNFPKDFLPLLEAGLVNEELVKVSSDKAEPTTVRENPEKGKATEEEPEKTKSVNTEGKEEEQNETIPKPTP
ncbi:hypothetical protein J1N35_013739 [Gossypium stocksii]|uniref:Uncharacterized protein n=1 Tax=Gossypium stocksii TaxID=47602 RepID=A0A9D3VU87_9ROSI|nr:hypothetical protein J1N35_013739 [Gossypium stocksii]